MVKVELGDHAIFSLLTEFAGGKDSCVKLKISKQNGFITLEMKSRSKEVGTNHKYTFDPKNKTVEVDMGDRNKEKHFEKTPEPYMGGLCLIIQTIKEMADR